MVQEVGFRRNDDSSASPSGFTCCADSLGVRVFTQSGSGAVLTGGAWECPHSDPEADLAY